MKYLVAIKREARGRVPVAWDNALLAIDGVSVESGLGTGRVRIEATADAIEEVRRTVGEIAHVEPILHRQAFG